MSSPAAAPANVRVLVRIRPFNDREAKFNPVSVLEIDNGGMASTIDFGMGSCSKSTSSAAVSGGSKGTVSIVDQNEGVGWCNGYESVANNAAATTTPSRSFTYDAVFGPQSKQDEIFDSVKGINDAVCAGYNGTIVAYGQTGSGKTHTTFGDDGLQDNNNAGLVQRSLKSIFHKIAEQSSNSPACAGAVAGGSIRTTTKASFLEIYNERVYDLLSPNGNFAEEERGLPVREDSTRGVYVEGLTEIQVGNTAEALDVLRSGMENRRVAATNMNRVSSRSHAMFVLTLKSELFSANGVSKVRVSKFTLVDLAGSERQKSTAADGDRLKEASMINNSLLSLGQVINSLVDREKGKQIHVPFRNATLTFLLRDSWGGNSKTCLVATVTPAFSSLSETISTLKFAQRAKLIKNTPVLNENTCGSVAVLQAEIARLRAELELKSYSLSANNRDQAVADPGLRPFPPKPNPSDNEDATVSTLLNQNSKLSKKVKVLTDATNVRVMQVNSLKRKLQQETFVHKCKERRIAFLSSKGKTSGTENDNEVACLREEVVILRERLEVQPSEAVEWMLKYREEKAKLEEMEMNTASMLTANKMNEMEASLVMLLHERDSLKQIVQGMSNERNTEIDSIIKEVTKLENANNLLQSRLEEKDQVNATNEDKIKNNEAQISELQEEIKKTVDCFESTQSELVAEKEKTVELRKSVHIIKMEVDQVNAAIMEHQSEIAVAEEEMKKIVQERNRSAATLNNKILELQKGLDTAMADNEFLVKKMTEASHELDANKTQLEILEQDRSKILKQLGFNQKKSNADIESLKLQEVSLREEMKKGKESFELLLIDKVQATKNLEKVTAHSLALSREMDALRSERNALQKRVESDKLLDHFASLEDEAACIAIEKQQLEKRFQFIVADLERTIRLQDHLSALQKAELDSELVSRDEIINNLSKDKSRVQDELAIVARKFAETSTTSDEKIAVLQNNLGKLQDHARSLEADIKKAENISDNLHSEKAQTAEQLAKVTGQSLALSGEVEALNSERNVLQHTLNAKITNLQKDLDVATGNNESLMMKLEEATADVEVQKSQLECLERDKYEVMKQLELSQEKSTAKLKFYKFQEESLRGEIKNGEEMIESLTGEKEYASKALENATVRIGNLLGEVVALKTERDALQHSVASLDAQVSEAKDRADASVIGLKMTEEHKKSMITLSNQTAELKKDLDFAMGDIELLTEDLKEASEDFEAKKTQLETLYRDKNEALDRLELIQEKSITDAEFFNHQEHTLTAETKVGRQRIQKLIAEKMEATESLDIVAAQSGSLVPKLEVLKTEQDSLQQNVEYLDVQVSVTKYRADAFAKGLKVTTKYNYFMTVLNNKISQLQKDLNIVKDGNTLLVEKFKEALGDLESKKNQLECLEQDKNELLKQLALRQEKVNAGFESLILQEESMKAEIEKGHETIGSLLAEKTQAVETLQEITAQENTFSGEMDALKAERCELQQHLDCLHDQVASLEIELLYVTNEREHVEENLLFAEADFQRTIMMQEQYTAALMAAYDHDLACRDEVICMLEEDKSKFLKDLAKFPHQFDKKAGQNNPKREGINAKFVAPFAEQEQNLQVQIREAELMKQASEKQIFEEKSHLVESEERKEQCKSNSAKVNELKELVKQLKGTNASLTASVEAGERECDDMKQEITSLKACVDALKEENVFLRGKHYRSQPSTSLSDIPSPWDPSPNKPVDEPALNTTFDDPDDTFDESMFLPNVDEQMDVSISFDVHDDAKVGGSNTPQTDENKAPPKSQFKRKRALFSPPRAQPASKKQTPTVGRKVVRSMMHQTTGTKTRTPLGKSAVQNTPSSSTRKVRTNWNNKSFF